MILAHGTLTAIQNWQCSQCYYSYATRISVLHSSNTDVVVGYLFHCCMLWLWQRRLLFWI